MKHVFVCLLCSFIIYSSTAQQQILLFTDTIEPTSTNFDLTTGGVGTNTGNNSWVINNKYNGAPLYGSTISQDSVVAGTINGAPNSTYLHIRDQAAQTSNNVANCNWNTGSASDRFAFTNNAYCTLGLTDVVLTFFWIGEGNANAYGEVYYRVDGGSWQKTGQAKYNNQHFWKYEIIQDTGFNNKVNLQFGFRWVNATGGASNASFGIDDIVAVGTYDDVNHPDTIVVDTVFPGTVCQNDFLSIKYHLNRPLCDGTYEIQMSDANGSFSSPYNGGVLNITAPDTGGYIGFQVPANVTGICFKVRINRISPAPQLTGIAGICFAITDCPESIVTNFAPVMNDNDTTCILSVIDVKFNSFGVFGPGTGLNTYTAQLSDANGSFSTPFTLGTLVNYDVAYPSQPGIVSGLIPANVPPGCGYYIRVISSSPAIVGTTIGPFCLTQCDELTNNHSDIHFCVPQGINADGLCQTLAIHPNQWNNQSTYNNCNDWNVELHSMTDFALINSGGLGIYHNTTGGSFSLCLPSVRDSLVVPAGQYYMRVVSTCGNQAWNQTGTVVRVTIGAPDTTAPAILADDTVVCNTNLVALTLSPFNHPPSDYEWASDILNNGNPFIWPYNPLLVDFSTSPPAPGTYRFYAREKNYGCYGPYSHQFLLVLIGTPDATITGPAAVCPGDTVTYRTPYMPETYYNWTTSNAVDILNEGNNESDFIFNNPGSYVLNSDALNECGSDAGSYAVNVVSPFNPVIGADHSVCQGANDTLHVDISASPRLFTSNDTAHAIYGRSGGMFNIIAHDDVTIDSFAVKYSIATPNSVNAQIWAKPGSYRGFEQLAGYWSQLGSYLGISPAPINQFTVVPIAVNKDIAAGDTFAFYVTTASPQVLQAASPTTGPQQSVYKSDGIIDFAQGTANNFSFDVFIPRVLNVRIYYTTKAGVSYLWSTGDTGSTVIFSPPQTGIYSVQVYDTSGCRAADSVLITVINCGNGINETAADAWSMVPNPTTGRVILQGAENMRSVTVYDTKGEKVLGMEGYCREIDLSDLSDGVYLVSVVMDKGTVSRRVVLLK